MELGEILNSFRSADAGFPKQAVEQAIARREEITPHLLAILENTIDNAAAINEEGGHMEHLFAMFLLAQFRETRAWPLVIRLASLPDPIADDLCGDFITEDLHRVLASVFDGNLELLYPLIEDRHCNEFIRGAGVNALATMVVRGILPRDAVVPYFTYLLRSGLEREGSHVWDVLASVCADLHPAEWMDDIVRAYENGLVNPGFIRLRSIEEAFGKDRNQSLETASRAFEYELVADVAQEFGCWAAFDDSPDEGWRTDLFPPLQQPFVRSGPKVGRNDPCPCGSGR